MLNFFAKNRVLLIVAPLVLIFGVMLAAILYVNIKDDSNEQDSSEISRPGEDTVAAKDFSDEKLEILDRESNNPETDANERVRIKSIYISELIYSENFEEAVIEAEQLLLFANEEQIINNGLYDTLAYLYKQQGNEELAEQYAQKFEETKVEIAEPPAEGVDE